MIIISIIIGISIIGSIGIRIIIRSIIATFIKATGIIVIVSTSSQQSAYQ